MCDPVAPEVRAAEAEIDRAHLANGLVHRPFPEAAAAFLQACEEHFTVGIINEIYERGGPHQLGVLADVVINHAKWPMRWLRDACPEEGVIRTDYVDDRYEEAWRLSNLAMDYLTFETAFVYASRGVGELERDGAHLRMVGPHREDTRFEAYDRIVSSVENVDDQEGVVRIAELLEPSLRVNGREFRYDLNPRLVRDALEWAAPRLERRFVLPGNWRLLDYSMAEYASVMGCIWVLSILHSSARMMAAMQGCPGLGYDSGLVVMGRGALVNRLRRYTGVDRDVVSRVVSDMTFGARGIQNPDIAHQPLVELQPDVIAWAPNLVSNNALERNGVVLLNRVPEGRDAYSRVSEEKEQLLRGSIAGLAEDQGLRTWSGDVAGWDPVFDLDLALISDRDRACLILELKSFIAPADIREIEEKGEEIARGIAQVRTRRAALENEPGPICRALGIDDDFRVSWAVASENSIGPSWVQDTTVPTIAASHLCHAIEEKRGLHEVIDWLEAWGHLPIEGTHYNTVDVTASVNAWTLDWHAIELLTTEYV